MIAHGTAEFTREWDPCRMQGKWGQIGGDSRGHCNEGPDSPAASEITLPSPCSVFLEPSGVAIRFLLFFPRMSSRRIQTEPFQQAGNFTLCRTLADESVCIQIFGKH